MKKLLRVGIIVSSILAMQSLFGAVQAQVRQPKATASMRQNYVIQQRQKLNPANFDLSIHPLTQKNIRHWQDVLWTASIFEPEESYVASAVAQLISYGLHRQLNQHEYTIVRSAMQLANQLYLHRPQFYQVLRARLEAIAIDSNHPEFVSMAVTTLYRSGIERNSIYPILSSFPKRFPNWAQNPFLFTTAEQISIGLSNPELPPLADLLRFQIAAQQPQLYVFCRSDRHQLCFTLLKSRTGKFVRAGDQLWSVPLLLQSLYSLDWNFFNGATPQGIYRMEGIVPQPDDKYLRAYGQFPLVKLFIPLEKGVRQFLPQGGGKFTGGLTTYQNLLPQSWRNYFPIQQTYWAGKIGRTYFRIHGSGEAPDYFQRLNSDRGEWNPTLGCLSSIETYDSDGNIIRADMPVILQTLKQHGNPELNGYVIVVDVPAQITLETIDSLLKQWHL